MESGDCVPRRGAYLAHRLSPRRAMPAIETPCTRICTVDPASGLCLGCGRSLAEIAGWIGFAPDERTRIMAELPQRLALLKSRSARSDVN
jgi:predicted Fe-S protein YdhL (DUF1289 family)